MEEEEVEEEVEEEEVGIRQRAVGSAEPESSAERSRIELKIRRKVRRWRGFVVTRCGVVVELPTIPAAFGLKECRAR